MPLSSRKRLELALLALPDEAFGYVALACWPSPVQHNADKVFPDGLGGFTQDSRDGIAAVRKAATDYVTEGGQ